MELKYMREKREGGRERGEENKKLREGKGRVGR